MGGEGSMMAANQSLKANRALKKKNKKKSFSFVSSTNENWVDPKKATPELLEEIRLKVKKDRKKNVVKLIAMTLFLLILFVGFIYSLTVLFS